jgi:hypothetical protein
MILLLLASSKVRKLVSDRKSLNPPPLPPSYNIWQLESHYLLPSTIESEYNFLVLTNVTPCGPILLPAPPLSKADPNCNHGWNVGQQS